MSAAFAYGYEAGRYAGWFDVGRHVIMPAGFLFVFCITFLRKLRHKDDPRVLATRGIERFPIWLGVFIFCWGLTCLHLFREPAHHGQDRGQGRQHHGTRPSDGRVDHGFPSSHTFLSVLPDLIHQNDGVAHNHTGQGKNAEHAK